MVFKKSKNISPKPVQPLHSSVTVGFYFNRKSKTRPLLVGGAFSFNDAGSSLKRLLRLTMSETDAKFVMDNNDFNSSLKIALDKLGGL